jgi:hypothetical protein
MSSSERLRVPVNGDLVLDAGECEQVEGSDCPARVVHPPQRTLFRQVLDYLEVKPDPEERPSDSGAGKEGRGLSRAGRMDRPASRGPGPLRFAGGASGRLLAHAYADCGASDGRSSGSVDGR